MKCLRKLQRLPEAMQVINEYLTLETGENLISSLLNDALDISVKLKGRMSIKKIIFSSKGGFFNGNSALHLIITLD